MNDNLPLAKSNMYYLFAILQHINILDYSNLYIVSILNCNTLNDLNKTYFLLFIDDVSYSGAQLISLINEFCNNCNYQPYIYLTPILFGALENALHNLHTNVKLHLYTKYIDEIITSIFLPRYQYIKNNIDQLAKYAIKIKIGDKYFYYLFKLLDSYEKKPDWYLVYTNHKYAYIKEYFDILCQDVFNEDTHVTIDGNDVIVPAFKSTIKNCDYKDKCKCFTEYYKKIQYRDYNGDKVDINKNLTDIFPNHKKDIKLYKLSK